MCGFVLFFIILVNAVQVFIRCIVFTFKNGNFIQTGCVDKTLHLQAKLYNKYRT